LAGQNARAVTPEVTLELLNQADLWRRPERFEQLLDTLVCTLGAEQAEFIASLRLAAQSAQDVSPQHLLKQGFQGKALGEAIRNERLARITQVLTP
ncbi:MAG: multifunctional CCA tRNA nucleotidyl transferase/2'3'-cyclic phosphodiesterase/2'nucleotidase/phosphatase, partial [Marinobacter sp.]